MYLIISILIVVVLAFLVWASADIGSNVHVRSYCRGPKDSAVAALTFDDGPHPVMTPKVLDVLGKHGVKATFFLVGGNVVKYPELVRRMVREGHLVCSHSYGHDVGFTYSSAANVQADLEKCRTAIENIAGKSPLLFRPPFGVTNPNIGKAVGRAGMKCIGWSIRSLDTVAGTPREDVVRKVMKKLHNGAVILLHDRCDEADIMLDEIIGQIKGRGYGFVTVDQLFDIEAYEKD